jgi:hypothetical protein
MARPQQLYILVAGDERDVGVVAARLGPATRLTDQQRETIRAAFLGPLRAGDADEALAQGVRAIGTTLAAAASGPGPGGRHAPIAVAILLVATLAALIVSHAWARGRRSETDAGGLAPDHPAAEVEGVFVACR